VVGVFFNLLNGNRPDITSGRSHFPSSGSAREGERHLVRHPAGDCTPVCTRPLTHPGVDVLADGLAGVTAPPARAGHRHLDVLCLKTQAGVGLVHGNPPRVLVNHLQGRCVRIRKMR